MGQSVVADPAYRIVMRATKSRVARVRVLQWILVPMPLVVACVFFTMSPDERLREFGDAVSALLVPPVIVAMAALLPASAWYLNGRYVERIAVSADGQRLEVHVLAAWGTRRIEGPKQMFVAGPVVGTGTRIQTPVFHLRDSAGRALIIDLQADYPEGPDAFFEALRTQPSRKAKKKR